MIKEKQDPLHFAEITTEHHGESEDEAVGEADQLLVSFFCAFFLVIIKFAHLLDRRSEEAQQRRQDRFQLGRNEPTEVESLTAELSKVKAEVEAEKLKASIQKSKKELQELRNKAEENSGNA